MRTDKLIVLICSDIDDETWYKYYVQDPHGSVLFRIVRKNEQWQAKLRTNQTRPPLVSRVSKAFEYFVWKAIGEGFACDKYTIAYEPFSLHNMMTISHAAGWLALPKPFCTTLQLTHMHQHVDFFEKMVGRLRLLICMR